MDASCRRLYPICTIPSEGLYELTESCRLTSEITVENGKTLTIVGIGAPTIDREQNGRHFSVIWRWSFECDGCDVGQWKSQGKS